VGVEEASGGLLTKVDEGALGFQVLQEADGPFLVGGERDRADLLGLPDPSLEAVHLAARRLPRLPGGLELRQRPITLEGEIGGRQLLLGHRPGDACLVPVINRKRDGDAEQDGVVLTGSPEPHEWLDVHGRPRPFERDAALRERGATFVGVDELASLPTLHPG